MTYYTLNEHGNPAREPDREAWMRWFKNADRSVNRTMLGNIQISTVFLAYGAGDDGPPIWETNVIGGALDRTTRQCAGTREQAEAQHKEVVNQVVESLPK